MTAKKVVIAGNYRQYVNWCRENNLQLRDAFYIDRIDQLFGLELAADDIVKVGTWYQRHDIDKLLEEANSRIRK